MKAKEVFILQKVKNYPFSVFLIIVIWVICLIPIPETPIDHVAFIDKWTHVAMYGALCLAIWLEYLKNHPCIHKKRLIVGGWLLPVLQGGLLELLQWNTQR